MGLCGGACTACTKGYFEKADFYKSSVRTYLTFTPNNVILAFCNNFVISYSPIQSAR